jgi:hypothetical protein
LVVEQSNGNSSPLGRTKPKPNLALGYDCTPLSRCVEGGPHDSGAEPSIPVTRASVAAADRAVL